MGILATKSGWMPLLAAALTAVSVACDGNGAESAPAAAPAAPAGDVCRAIDASLIRGVMGGEASDPVVEGSTCVVQTSAAAGSIVFERFVGADAVAQLRAKLASDASVARRSPQGEPSGPAPDEYMRLGTGVWLVSSEEALGVTTTACCASGQADLLRVVAYNSIGPKR